MATVIRLKRRLDEDPSETLLLNCKRKKIETDDDPNLPLPTTFFQFAGTLDKDADVFAHIKSANTKAELEEKFKTHDVKCSLENARKCHDDLAKSSRYKVVDCKRALDNEEVTILDVETEASKEEDCPGYVFDVYCTNVESTSWDFEGLEYSVLGALQSDESMFSQQNADGSDSEDSNAENYYKNDYPDEESNESDSDMEEMQRCMKDLDFNSDDDLSSDVLSEDGEENNSDYNYYCGD